MPDEPVYMLNVLWFQPNGGRERYREYLRAAAPIVARFGGKKLDSYVPVEAVIGTFDADLVFTVEWPSWDVFQRFVADPDYQAIRHLREEAIRDSLLVRCRKFLS
ncbi:MAG: DUF1330 domain-containing protein [Pirellulales bacterium]